MIPTDWFNWIIPGDDITLGFGQMQAAFALFLLSFVVFQFSPMMLVYLAIAIVKRIWFGLRLIFVPISVHAWRNRP